MGRKSIPIEPYIDKLEQAMLLGARYDLAAMYAGISDQTFRRWRQQAEHAKEGTPLARLRDRLTQAEGRAAIGWLAKIEKAASEGNWQAAAWKLERRYPEDWGRHDRVDLQITMQKVIAKVAADMGLSTEALLVEAEALLAEVTVHGRDPSLITE